MSHLYDTSFGLSLALSCPDRTRLCPDSAAAALTWLVPFVSSFCSAALFQSCCQLASPAVSSSSGSWPPAPWSLTSLLLLNLPLCQFSVLPQISQAVWHSLPAGSMHRSSALFNVRFVPFLRHLNPILWNYSWGKGQWTILTIMLFLSFPHLTGPFVGSMSQLRVRILLS